jgi:hypothetical protein
MDRIEGSNWIARKRLAGALDDFRANTEGVPARCRHCEVCAPIRCFSLRQLTKRGGPQQHAIALDEGQVGRDNGLGGRHQPANAGACRFVEEPRQDGAGLGVQGHLAPRSSSSSCAAVAVRLRFRGSAGYRLASPRSPSVARPRLARTRSAGGRSASAVPRPGGASSATTSPRSVTSTLSPERTWRMYSLSRFFNSRMPTVFMPLQCSVT